MRRPNHVPHSDRVDWICMSSFKLAAGECLHESSPDQRAENVKAACDMYENIEDSVVKVVMGV